MIEKFLVRLILFHILALIFIQGYLHPAGYVKPLNKVYLYEGTGAGHHEEKMDVFRPGE